MDRILEDGLIPMVSGEDGSKEGRVNEEVLGALLGGAKCNSAPAAKVAK